VDRILQSLYTVSGYSNTVTAELEQITPASNEYALHDILYVEVEAAMKRFKKTKAQVSKTSPGK
jgi:hypothetical protein